MMKIKIDRSFIKDIAVDYRSRAITSGIIDIAKGFGIQVVAEGVETDHQLRILEELGCEQAQGFYLSHPIPVEELKEKLNITSQDNKVDFIAVSSRPKN